MNLIKLGKHEHYSLMTLILSWSALAVMSSLYVTIPLIDVFAQNFMVSANRAVWTSSAFSFCFAAGCLVYGPLSDRYGRKKIIFSGLAALTVVSLCLGFTNALGTMIVLRAIQGAAAATFSPVALAYIPELFPPAKRIGVIGCISTSFLMAGVIGQVFSGLIQTHWGWHSLFFVMADAYFITAALILFFLPHRPANGASVIAAFRQMPGILRRKQLRYAYVVAAIVMLSLVGMYTALGNYLSDQFGLTNHQILGVRAVGIFGMLLSPTAGRLVKKFKTVPVLRNALGLAVIGLILLAFASNIPVMIVSSVVFVAGIAIATPSLISLIGELAGNTRGPAISVYTFVLFLGASIGPLLATNLLNHGINYTLTFLALAVCVVIGVIATFFIKDAAVES
ncbi:MAG: MFS transporter [Peptococcaceae bacterium]|nr:MFS transporter [Peptococcaceae bacterium]